MSDTPEHGIHRDLIDTEGLIRGPAWYRAWEAQEAVGTCRSPGCHGVMVPLPNSMQGQHVWYGAACWTCHTEIAARSDQPVLRRSSRRSEMASGSWEQRDRWFRQVNEARQRAAA